MAEPTSGSRDIAIATPLGEDAVVLESMTGHEHLSEPFEFKVSLLSTDRNIKGEALLGENVTIRLRSHDPDTPRYFNGFVTSFSQLPHKSIDLARYQIIVHPWLWFLTRTSDCRIFQEMTVPDIIKEVFRDHGFSDFEERVEGTPRTWEYCVQYRETDFNFVSRLMEQEGIYYYFLHEDGLHKMILSNHRSSHDAFKHYETIPYYIPDPGAQRERDHINQWVLTQQVRSGKCAINSFDFKSPKKSLSANGSTIRKHKGAEYEIYDYPGDYSERADGQNYVDLRMEELASGFEIIEGAGDARGMLSGATFSLSEFPRPDQNREYLILGVEHTLQLHDYASGEGSAETQYECAFKVIDATQPYRAPLSTPKPEIRGPQTAIVVGPAGEEITTDEYGRVKVKFHWDRYAKADESASCWIRVSQAVAGQNWGSIILPRHGQEVLVEFLEGDPDMPIITGRVYNGDNKPPYTLPDKKTISTLKSNSSKGGGGFNEIRLDDTKGEEQIFVHGEKNHDVRVKNNRFEWIGNDRHLKIKNDKFEEVENNRNEIVAVDHKEEIGKDRHLKVKGKEAKAVDKTLSLTVTDDVAEVFKKNHSHEVSKDLYIKATNICIEASSNITIKVGQSSIAINNSGVKIANSSGTIELDAMNVKQNASIGWESKGGVTAKLEGTMSEVKGSGMLTLQGGLVKIN